MAQIVLGLDCGGTYTRVVAADLSGRVLAAIKTRAAPASESASPAESTRAAIRDVLAKAGCKPGDVVQLVAGIASLDSPQDQKWADEFTALPELLCPRLHVNDAVVAHAGAFRSQPGIVAIAGTGSIVFGVTETGQPIRNFDFNHYAFCSALHLSYEAIYRLLAGAIHPNDSEFVGEVLAFWGLKELSELRDQVLEGFVADPFLGDAIIADMAPLVTEAAQEGAPLARAACDSAAEALGTGVRLVGGCFTAKTVPVALIGGVVQSNYMQGAMERALAKSREVQFQMVDPAFPGEVGAVLMALEMQNISIDKTVLDALRTRPEY